jgi:hypothetical protein
MRKEQSGLVFSNFYSERSRLFFGVDGRIYVSMMGVTDECVVQGKA